MITCSTVARAYVQRLMALKLRGQEIVRIVHGGTVEVPEKLSLFHALPRNSTVHLSHVALADVVRCRAWLVMEAGED